MKKWLRTDDRGRLVHSRRETLGSKKKGSLDGTGYKREDARCGREGTRGPSKQIRRTSRFLLDLLLDLSIYLSIYLASILAGLSDRDHRTRGSTSFPLPSSLSLFPPPLFSFPLGGRKHGTRKCAHGADTWTTTAEWRDWTRLNRVGAWLDTEEFRAGALVRWKGGGGATGVPREGRLGRREVGGGGARGKRRMKPRGGGEGGRIGGNGAIKGRSWGGSEKRIWNDDARTRCCGACGRVEWMKWEKGGGDLLLAGEKVKGGGGWMRYCCWMERGGRMERMKSDKKEM